MGIDLHKEYAKKWLKENRMEQTEELIMFAMNVLFIVDEVKKQST